MTGLRPTQKPNNKSSAEEQGQNFATKTQKPPTTQNFENDEQGHLPNYEKAE